MAMDMRRLEERQLALAVQDEIFIAMSQGCAALLDLLSPYCVERILNEHGSSVTYDKRDDGRIEIHAYLPDGDSYMRILGYQEA